MEYDNSGLLKAMLLSSFPKGHSNLGPQYFTLLLVKEAREHGPMEENIYSYTDLCS